MSQLETEAKVDLSSDREHQQRLSVNEHALACSGYRETMNEGRLEGELRLSFAWSEVGPVR